MSDSRTKILDAASVLFLKGGTSALSVRAIAKEAGLSTIGIYSHFQGKQGILDALYIQGFDLIYDAMDIPIRELSREDILQTAKAYLDVGESKQAHYQLMFGDNGSEYTPSEEAVAAGHRAFGKLVHVTTKYLPGDATAAYKRQLALDVWVIVHGYVSIKHHRIFGDNYDFDWKKMALRAIEVHLDGLTGL